MAPEIEESAFQEGLINITDKDKNSEDEKNKSTVSSWRICQDKEYRDNILRSSFIIFGFFWLGATESQSGPTFLDIQIITDTGPEMASIFFTVHSFGYLVGCILAGLISKQFRRSFLIFSNLLAMSCVTIVVPYCSHLAAMIAAKVIGGVFAGLVDTYCNADQMALWGNKGQALMQLLHFMYAFGGLMSPLITAPFLAEREDDDVIATNNVTASTTNNVTASTTANWNQSLSGENSSVAEIELQTQRPTTNVHFAFLITGMGTLIASIPFLVIYLKERQQTIEAKVKGVEVDSKLTKEPVSYRQIPRRLKFFLIFILCAFYVFYSGIEDPFAALLMTFLVNTYSDDVTKTQAAYFLTIYWSSFAIARFLMIFLAKLFSPFQLLTSSVALMFLSFLAFLLLAHLGQALPVSIVSGVVGISMSGIFAAGFSWCESEYLRVSNAISACILISSTLGVTLNPMLIVFAMEQKGNMWFCYLFMTEVCIMVIIFTFLILVNQLYLNRKYGPLRIHNYDEEYKEEDTCVSNT